MIEYKNRATGVNDVSVGSPSRIRIVRRISLGITTLPRSSILRTIPVAFMIFIRISFLIQIFFKFGELAKFYIYENLLTLQITALLVSAN